MANFTISPKRFIEDTVAIPTTFLSQEIRDCIVEDLGFLPDNAYVSNAAGDYVFINVVKDTKVYTLTDCYNLDSEMKDKGV